MKMPLCRNAAVGFLPVISRPYHYGVSRSEEKQRAAAGLTRCWVLLQARGSRLEARGSRLVARGGRCCSGGGSPGRFFFFLLNRFDEVAQLCPALCLETLTGLY